MSSMSVNLHPDSDTKVEGKAIDGAAWLEVGGVTIFVPGYDAETRRTDGVAFIERVVQELLVLKQRVQES